MIRRTLPRGGMATKATMDQLKRAIREAMAHTTSRAATEITALRQQVKELDDRLNRPALKSEWQQQQEELAKLRAEVQTRDEQIAQLRESLEIAHEQMRKLDDLQAQQSTDAQALREALEKAKAEAARNIIRYTARGHDAGVKHGLSLVEESAKRLFPSNDHASSMHRAGATAAVQDARAALASPSSTRQET